MVLTTVFYTVYRDNVSKEGIKHLKLREEH